MKKRWILCTVAVLCIAAALLGCVKKNVGTPEDNATAEEDTDENADQEKYLIGFSVIDMENPYFSRSHLFRQS